MREPRDFWDRMNQRLERVQRGEPAVPRSTPAREIPSWESWGRPMVRTPAGAWVPRPVNAPKPKPLRRARQRRVDSGAPIVAAAAGVRSYQLYQVREMVRRGVKLGMRQHACPCRHLTLAAWLAFTGTTLRDALALSVDDLEALRAPLEAWDLMAFWLRWRKRWGVHVVEDAPLFCTITVSSSTSRRQFWPGPLSEGNARNAIRRLGERVGVVPLTAGRLTRSGPFHGLEWVPRPQERPKHLRSTVHLVAKRSR